MPPPAPGASRLEILLLGPVEARLDGEALTLTRQKLRALLALLALSPNEVVSTDRALDALWGEQPPPTAPVALYGLVSALRKALGPEGVQLVTRPPGYALDVPADTIDLGRFQLLVAAGRRALDEGDPTSAAASLTEALALWRGPPLHDLAPLPFAELEVGRLAELRLAAVEDRIEADLGRGRNGDLVPELERLVAEHPLRERLRGQLMRALYRAGRQADSLAAYRAARQTLVDELGLEPSDDLQALERSILQHDAALAPPENGAQPTPHAPGRRPYRWIALAGAAAIAGIAVAALTLRDAGGGAVSVIPNGVGVIENGRLVAADAVGASPSDVAVTSDSAWVTSTDDQTVAKVDPDTGRVQQTIKVGSGASGVAADEHGVWVANALAGTVTRIDPRVNGGRVVETIRVGESPVALALDGDVLWVVNRDDQALVRLDARTGRKLDRIPVGGSPRAVAVSPGAVWVADDVQNAVFRIDPVRRTVVHQINVGNGPVSVAVGKGSVWVADNLSGTVDRIDPARNVVVETIPVGDGPRGLAVVPDGVWVSNEFDGTLRLIDARTNRVTRTIRIAGRPEGIAAAGAKLIVAVRPESTVHRGGTLRIGSPVLIPSLDTLSGSPAALDTNDGLVGFRKVGGTDGGELVPDLAVAIPAPTDGGRSYSFRLRPGIRYSNGQLVRPADFRRALERAIVRAPDIAYYYRGIVGAERCVPRPARCDLARGIVGDERARTVTFHLRAPDPDFLYALGLPYAFAVPADTPLKDVGRHAPPATGPYMVGSFDPRTHLTLVRNPRFREWSKAAQPDGYPDRMVVTPTSPVEGVRAAESGKLDLAFNVPAELQHAAATRYASQLHVNPLNGVTYLFLNTKVAPFDDLRARRAVSYAADRAAAVRISARARGAEATCQILPPDFPGYRPYCPYTSGDPRRGVWKAADLTRARALVAASGTLGMPVEVWVPTSHLGEGPYLAALLRSIGYRARYRDVSMKAFYGHGGPPQRVQAGVTSWFADFPAASNYIGFFFACDGPGNMFRFCDRSIDRRISRARALQATDPYLANGMWASLDRAIVDRAPMVPLVAFNEVDMVSRRVGNYQFTPQWGVLPNQLWVR